MVNNKNNIGTILKSLRIEKHLNQVDLSSLLNIKRQTYSAWERNVSSPDINTINFLANYYSVSTDYLLDRTNKRTSTDKIEEALEDDQELSTFWKAMKERPELKLMFKQTKNLSPQGIQQIIRIIKAIEDEEDREDN